jgi:hypothetical protein
MPVLALAALVATTGCAALQREGAMQQERLLAAAGFQMKFANTPTLAAKAAEMPQRRVVPVPADDGVRYVWADAKYCNCIYAGSEKAYDRYQRLVVQSDIAAENEEAATEMQEAQFDWGAWGMWGPWW